MDWSAFPSPRDVDEGFSPTPEEKPEDSYPDEDIEFFKARQLAGHAPLPSDPQPDVFIDYLRRLRHRRQTQIRGAAPDKPETIPKSARGSPRERDSESPAG